ncbi:MAG: amino acid adenylation domain-containing protein, partial [Caldilineaceae bacterium]|nr:amino acid adenylation domain-containing protein [Caldilineaceae bacterium]
MNIPTHPTSTGIDSQRALRIQSRHPSGIIADFTFADFEDSLPGTFCQGRGALRGSNRSRKWGSQADLFPTRCGFQSAARAILNLRGAAWEPVAMIVRGGVSHLIALYGITKANKAYVPILPNSPPARVAMILEELDDPLIVVDAASLPSIQTLQLGSRGRLLLLEEASAQGTDEAVSLTIAPDTPIHIRYTSGSTGRPKGVVNASRDLLFKVHAHIETGSLCHLDRLTKFGADTPDAMVMSLVGGAYVSADLERYGMLRMAELLQAAEVTVLRSTATAFRQLLRNTAAGVSYPQLRLVIVNGEPPTGDDIQAARPFSRRNVSSVTRLAQPKPIPPASSTRRPIQPQHSTDCPPAFRWRAARCACSTRMGCPSQRKQPGRS